MNFKVTFLAAALASTALMAGPVYQMNKAFNALADLIPYLTNSDDFMQKKNEALIKKQIKEMETAFKMAKHDNLLKDDLFAPSYATVMDNISGSLAAFEKGNKDYAHWRLKQITSNCMDCHSRLPPSHASSFQNGELTIDQGRFKDPYNLGVAYFIVRKYPDAKASLLRSIQDKYIKKDFRDLILPFKQLLVIDTKILMEPTNLIVTLKTYRDKKETPPEVRSVLTQWLSGLAVWKKNKFLKSGLHSDKEVDAFIKQSLAPLKNKASFDGNSDVDLLFASGLLSQYRFNNTESKEGPEINFWLGWAEKRLQRENFFGSGDLFLKQCIKKYPKHPVARDCYKEYEESVEFEFSGSSGTDIPADVQKELNDLKSLLK